MNKKEKALRLIDTSRPGIEIGPLYSPIAPKKEGCNVKIIDFMDRDGLIDAHGHAEDIEEVDFVWNGESYAELTGEPAFYEWIVASHVIEHMTDMIWFLKNCDLILKTGGILSLVVPDKRYCFDYFRPISSLGKVIDANDRHNTFPSNGTACEYYLNVVNLDGNIAWYSGAAGKYSFAHPDSRKLITDFLYKRDVYRKRYDFHVWVFTPSSFRLMISDLNMLGYTRLSEVEFHSTEGCEFFISLSRVENPRKFDRMEMLKRIRDEQIST